MFERIINIIDCIASIILLASLNQIQIVKTFKSLEMALF